MTCDGNKPCCPDKHTAEKPSDEANGKTYTEATDRPTILWSVNQRLVHYLNIITCGLSRHSCSQKITHNGSYLCDKSSASVLDQTSHHLVTVGLSRLTDAVLLWFAVQSAPAALLVTID